jgi:hypothetical protein
MVYIVVYEHPSSGLSVCRLPTLASARIKVARVSGQVQELPSVGNVVLVNHITHGAVAYEDRHLAQQQAHQHPQVQHMFEFSTAFGPQLYGEYIYIGSF